MARMHSRKRGKSGSHKDYTEDPRKFVTHSDTEIVDTLVALKKDGLTKSQIGIKLRDQYGVASTKAILGKKVGEILKENGLQDQVPEDLMHLIKKYQNASRHNAINTKDRASIRSAALIMSKILRLVRYYKSNGYIPREWNLDKVIR
ncbi:MAG: 30S ribosomal protein S15 [Candidatus Thermoplasmatota archaeon]|jgi:small subunit ribosomal protein S15|nr:30S ribosomal protein S15 [Candidatus Thermoplasmatota archaeon]MCL5794181.1 30S ribosomal protein S15 [Candidatus Thermoplasmatota archaeon]